MDVNMANKVTSFDLFLQNVYLSQLASCIAMGTIHSSYFFELSERYKFNVLLCPLFRKTTYILCISRTLKVHTRF
jgi:hypothetical protein